jgi:acyl-CoA dehydrogenase
MDVVMPYFLEYCDPEQRRRWFPGLASGALFTAIGMTEPGTGSDLAVSGCDAIHQSLDTRGAG